MAAGNQQLKLTYEILTNGSNIPTSKRKENVKTCADKGFPFLDMNMSWSPEGDL